jgi:hypothetical protein
MKKEIALLLTKQPAEFIKAARERLDQKRASIVRASEGRLAQTTCSTIRHHARSTRFKKSRLR